MTADEIRKGLHAASVHLSQKRKTGDYRDAIKGMILSDLYGAEEHAENKWNKPGGKAHIAWLLASASMQAMELLGKYTPEDVGLDAIHGGAFHGGSKWSQMETVQHIAGLRKVLRKPGATEAERLAELVGQSRSICEGIGEDLFAIIEYEMAKPNE